MTGFFPDDEGGRSLVYDRWDRDGNELNNGIAVLLEFNLKAERCPLCVRVRACV